LYYYIYICTRFALRAPFGRASRFALPSVALVGVFCGCLPNLFILKYSPFVSSRANKRSHSVRSFCFVRLCQSVILSSVPQSTQTLPNFSSVKIRSFIGSFFRPQLHTVAPFVRSCFTVVVSIRLHFVAPYSYNPTALSFFGGSYSATHYAVLVRLRLNFLFFGYFTSDAPLTLLFRLFRSQYFALSSFLVLLSRSAGSFWLPLPRTSPASRSKPFYILEYIAAFFRSSFACGCLFRTSLIAV
jgi:hypothetical protein